MHYLSIIQSIFKSNFRNYLLLCLCLLLWSVSPSQTQAQNYIKGFVITLEGDTIQGMIDHQEWRYNPDWIDFKAEGTDKVTKYTPEDITAFKLTAFNWLYSARKVKLNISPRQLDRLRTGRMPEELDTTLFLQTLVLGDVNLYYYKHPSEKEYFLIDNEEISLQELVYDLYLQANDDFEVIGKARRLVVEKEKFRGQLKYALRKCPDVINYINTMHYEYNAFRKLFNTYTKCIGEDKTNFVSDDANFQSQKQKRRLDFGLMGGLNQTTIVFTKGLFGEQTLKFRDKQTSTLGFFLSRPVGNWDNVSIYHLDIALKPMVTQFIRADEDGNIQEYPDYTIRKFYLKTTHLLKIQPIERPINPYFSVGGSASASLMATEYLSVGDIDVGPNDSNLVIWENQVIELGLVAAVGVQSSLFFLECRYEITNGVSWHIPDVSSTTRGIGVFGGVYLSELFQKNQETSRKSRYKRK